MKGYRMLLTENKALRQLAGVLETGNLLALKLLLRNPGALRTFPNAMFREYMSLARRDRWNCAEVTAVVPEVAGTRITIEHLMGGGINTPLDELATLALLTKAIGPATVLEIGTFRGRTALNFALNSPEDCRIYTLDLPPTGRDTAIRAANSADAAIIQGSATGIDYQGKDVAHKIVQLYGDSTTYDFRPYFGKVELVFVDGAHHYAAAKSDTLNAIKMVRPGGMIIWHDFANYGDYNDVTRAVLACLPAECITQIAHTQLAVYRHQVPLSGESAV